jgi:anaerobic dimethyl sulfoxide reductase subunit A
MLVAHKKGDVIVRLSTDDGRYQRDGFFGKDTPEEPQVRGCLRGRSYRMRLYSPERLLYPMLRMGERGEGKFRRASWDEALGFIADKMTYIKRNYGPAAILDQSYAGASWGAFHKSDQIAGILGHFLGMFGCRTVSWSVPSYQGTTYSAMETYGSINDGNEDDTFAHTKLMIMWGWNVTYTFHGGNTFYYMRLAKQRGCKFVLVDPQYTDAAAAYDAWWLPIKPNTDAAMMAGMAYYIFVNNLQDQEFINRFTQGIDAGTMPMWAWGRHENFKDYILGRSDGIPKTPEWASQICGISAEDIKKLAHMYATTKPAALKASWAPGRAAYGEQYSRMAIALQSITGNIGKVGGSGEGVGKGYHLESDATPFAGKQPSWSQAIKSDRWAHLVLNYPNVRRDEIGLWEKADMTDGIVPNIRAIWWHGSNWFNQLTNINREIQAIKKLDLVVCMDATITPSGLFADVLLPSATHFERHDVALPWYKGHYYIHRPKVIEPLGEAKTDWQIFTELAWRLGFGQAYNPLATRDYFHYNDGTDETYLRNWWTNSVMPHHHIDMTWEEFKQRGVYKFILNKPYISFEENVYGGKPFMTPSGRIEIFSNKIASVGNFSKTKFGSYIPSIPKWIEPFEWLGHPKAQDYPFHLVTPHPRWRTHTIFNNIPQLREVYEQEVTINAEDAKKLGIKTGDTVEVFNDRGKVVVPAYVTERCRPGAAVLHEGVWLDIDENGIDRAGNPDFLTSDTPSPAGAFAYNTILVNIRKSELDHRPGWDKLATARSHVFRRESQS